MSALARALPYTERFAGVAATLPGAGHPAMAALRRRAIQRAALGLPTARVERWKYTSLNPLFDTPFEPAREAEREVSVELPEAPRLVFVNGRLAQGLSRLEGLPSGIELGGLGARLAADGGGLAAQLALHGEDDALGALNTAFMADGCVLTVGRGVALDEAIHLLFVGRAGEAPLAFHARNLIRLEPGASATVIERHIGDDAIYWSNPLSEIAVGQDARLQHYKLQDEAPRAIHLAQNRVTVAAGGCYESLVLAVGGALARNEIAVRLAGAGARCRLDGVYLARGRQHIDNTTEIVHEHPETVSRETYKGVLDERARAVFQGRIVVRPDAQKADGQQLNKTLLLSAQAEIDSKPELEIRADDVKCGHGAAVGALDEEALFYLRARGLDGAAASRLLTEAFVSDVIEAITDAGARAAVALRVGEWLGAVPESNP